MGTRPLEPKAFQVLNCLLTHRDRAVSKDELLDTCWPGDNVTEGAITRVIKVIRQAVDDDGAQQHTIKTRHGYGYRFIASVEIEPPADSTVQAPAAPLSLDRLDAEPSPVLPDTLMTGSTRENRYALLIGNGHYPLDEALPDLSTPQRDVEGLADVLTQSQSTRFQTVQQLKNASHREALDTLSRLLHAVQKDDLILVYVSGHARFNDQGDFYLAFTNTQSSLLDTTSLSFEQLKDAIDACQSTRIMLILDCCFSSVIGVAIDLSDLEHQMRRLASGRGKYILNAAPAPQDTHDRQTETYSLLTRYVIEGLSTGKADLDHAGYVTADQLYQYAFSNVLEESKPAPMKWDLSGKGGLILAGPDKRPAMGVRSLSSAAKAHYDTITQLLQKGDVIPCLGPGIADPFSDPYPPIDNELAQLLANRTGFADHGDPLPLISQKIDIVAGRGVLYDHLRDIYQPGPDVYRPALIHRFLARLPEPQVILSTAYDTLLEQAFHETGKAYAVVTHILHADNTDQGKVAVQYSDRKDAVEKHLPQEFVIDLSKWSVIYKIHGTFGLWDQDTQEEIDSIVISEEDHLNLVKLLDRPQSTMPNHVARKFKKSMFLFLGYRISDWNFRAIIDVVQDKSNFRRVQPYSAQEDATEFERFYWEHKRVRLLETDLHTLIHELADIMGIDV